MNLLYPALRNKELFLGVILVVGACTHEPKKIKRIGNSSNSEHINQNTQQSKSLTITSTGTDSPDGTGTPKVGVPPANHGPVEALRFKDDSDWSDPYIAFSGHTPSSFSNVQRMTDDGGILSLWWEMIDGVSHVVAHRFDPQKGWLKPVVIDMGMHETDPEAVLKSQQSEGLRLSLDGAGNAVALWVPTYLDKQRTIWSNTYIKGKGWQKRATKVVKGVSLNAFKFTMNSAGQGMAIWSDNRDRTQSPPISTSIRSLWGKRFHMLGGWSSSVKRLATQLHPNSGEMEAITIDPQGNMILTYLATAPEAAKLMWRRFDWTGDPARKGTWRVAVAFEDSELKPNTAANGIALRTKIAFGDSGNALVVWRTDQQDFIVRMNVDGTVERFDFPFPQQEELTYYKLWLRRTGKGFLLVREIRDVNYHRKSLAATSSTDDGATWTKLSEISSPDRRANDELSTSLSINGQGHGAAIWRYGYSADANHEAPYSRTFFAHIAWNTTTGRPSWSGPRIIHEGRASYLRGTNLLMSPSGKLALTTKKTLHKDTVLLISRNRNFPRKRN